jgi:hypothetical protein
MDMTSNAYLIGLIRRLGYSIFEGTAWAEVSPAITKYIEQRKRMWLSRKKLNE